MEQSEELLEKAIEDGFAQLDEATDTKDYCDKVKAVKDLYDLKVNEYRAQADDAHRNDEFAIEQARLEKESAQEEEDRKWYKKINPNTVITTLAMVAMSAVTIAEQHEGWIFKPDGFLSKLMNRDK